MANTGGCVTEIQSLVDYIIVMSLIINCPRPHSFVLQTSEGNSLKDFKTTRQEEDVKCALRDFISENPCVKVSGSTEDCLCL